MRTLPRFSEAPARWTLLLAALVLFVPAAWRLGVSDSMYHMEQMSLLPGQETWLRMHQGEPEAWLTPSLRGEPRIRKPPMLIWLNLAAWSDLDPDTATPADLTVRARWVALLLALAGLFSTAWIARQLYGPEAGVRAALALAAMYSVIKQARMATFDTHLLGWTALAVGASLAFANPDKRGWRPLWFALALLGSVCGILTKGPVALVVWVPALALLWGRVGRGRYRPILLWIPTLLGLLAYGGWTWTVLRTVPGAGETLLSETLQVREDPQPVWYYLVIVGVVFPWTLLWAGLVPACRKLTARERAPWWILLAGILILSMADNRRQRYLIPLLPYFAIGFALLWEQRHELRMGWALKAHAVLLAFVSAVIPFALPFQARMVNLGWIQDLELPGAGIRHAVILAALLWPLAWALIRSAFRERGRHLLPLTAVWMSLFYTFAMHFYVHSYHGQYPHEAEVLRLREETQGARLYITADPARDWTPPDDRFLYHSGRFFRPATLDRAFEPGDRVLVPAEHRDAAPDSWREVDSYEGRRRYTLFAVP